MLELYQDTLIDLLLLKNVSKSKKLEIKKDSKVSHPLTRSVFDGCPNA